jgi:putative transposase
MLLPPGEEGFNGQGSRSASTGLPRFTVTSGCICLGQRKVNLSRVFAGQIVGIREVDDQIWLFSFLDFDLGFFDQDEGRVEPVPDPFVPEKVLTMSPE